MNYNEIAQKATELKERYSEGRFEGVLSSPGEPGAVFALEADIIVGDMADQALKRYNRNTLELKQSLDLRGEGVGWSCGYDEGSANVYVVGSRKKELLLLDPSSLEIMERIPVGVDMGIYFSWQGERYFIPGLSSPHEIRILRKGTAESSDIVIEPSPVGRDHLPYVFYTGEMPWLFYMDSKLLLRLEGRRFSPVQSLGDLNGRLYRVQALPQGDGFLALTNQGGAANALSVIHMYDRAWNFRRILGFPGHDYGGNFHLEGDRLFLASRKLKEVSVFRYNPHVFQMN